MNTQLKEVPTPADQYVKNMLVVSANGVQIGSKDGLGIIIAEDGVMPMFLGEVKAGTVGQMKFTDLAFCAVEHGKEEVIEMYQSGQYPTLFEVQRDQT